MLFTGILQALCASKLQFFDTKLSYRREYIDFGLDFGYFALDWAEYQGVEQSKSQPLVIVLSGLTASRVEPYIQNFISELCKVGKFRVVLYNDRLFNNRIYLDPERQALIPDGNFHHVEDFRRVLLQLIKTNPIIYCVGHSFGANTMMRYIGQSGSLNERQVIKAAVSVGNPYDFQLGLKYLEGSISDPYIRMHRQRIIKLKEKQFRQLDLEPVYKAKSSFEFDTTFTKKIFSAPSCDFHYFSINSINMIPFVKIPIFMLGSYDDPVINRSVYPKEAILTNSNIISMMTHVGGHISWITGFRLKRWHHKPVIEYLLAVSQVR